MISHQLILRLPSPSHLKEGLPVHYSDQSLCLSVLTMWSGMGWVLLIWSGVGVLYLAATGTRAPASMASMPPASASSSVSTALDWVCTRLLKLLGM